MGLSDRRVCVIFNPAARGDRARRFRSSLAERATPVEWRPTTGPGTARTLAREAVEDGYDLVVAAGGDGTVFEVLNGLADVPDGFDRAALGVIPFGTANVFAHELGVPNSPATGWEALQSGILRRIDCGLAEFRDQEGGIRRAHFSVVAGAGLDARAVQLVNWGWKRRTGKLAYIAAALRAWAAFPDRPTCEAGGERIDGRVILVGNGRFYAGDVPLFGDGRLDSGRLHVRAVRRVGVGVLLRCLVAYLTGRWTLEGRLPAATVSELRLASDKPVPLQLDGELAGWLPATLKVLPGALQVWAPAPRTRH